ncbi:MAG: hypothetical protein OCD00_03355 [Colwellia sp.]
MKPLLFLGLITLVLSCSNATQKPSTIPTEGGGSPTSLHNPNIIFDYIPQNIDTLIMVEALGTYFHQYRNASGVKSFAQSEGGAWAYVTNRETQEVSDIDVLNACEKHNIKFSEVYPCKLINVSGKWLDYPNRAQEILAMLPEFSPQVPIDLRKLRSNASKDMQNKNYAMALAKRVWFHQHALEVNEHYSAVRLSYGLMDWAKLGDIYPPAKTLLRYTANHAKYALMANPKDSTLLHEYISINEVLKRTDQSINLFKWLDTNHPKIASRNFYYFKDVLTKHELFSLYNKHLRPNVDYSQMASNYVRAIDTSKREVYGDKNKSQEMLARDTKYFIYNVSRLVTILVINERMDEAKIIVKKAMLELTSDEFTLSLNNALKGQLPQGRF